MDQYIESSRKQFLYYKSLGEKTFDQLEDHQLFWQANEHQNSIAILVKHLWGNMMSRWTDFLTTDGEKNWRKRDEEFEPTITTRAELLVKWEEGWNCLWQALATVNEENQNDLVYIRNMGHSIIDAVNRQLCHYAYHVGQIVLIGKLMTEDQWRPLSIPKGESATYNKEKFTKPKAKKHFTEDL